MKKIFFIDDEIEIVKTLQLFLSYDYQVTVSTDPMTALDDIKKLKPEALIIDLWMPKKSGFTLIKEVRDSLELQNIPIIALSGMGIGEGQRVKDSGADAYISKPFFPTEIKNCIEHLTQQNVIRN